MQRHNKIWLLVHIMIHNPQLCTCVHVHCSTVEPGAHTCRGRSVHPRFIENQTALPLRHVMMFIDARACMSDILIDDG